MRKILIATHGEFAGGLKQTMDFVLGKGRCPERVYHTGF